jgi:membrane associated rhomboid family serine protease
MATTSVRIVRVYLAFLGVLLLAHGAGSLVLRALGLTDPSLTHGFVHADPLHALIHIVWGSVMLLFLVGRANDGQVVSLALIFGAFYVSLAFLGVLVYHPFGLELGPFENTFHFIVGPSTLALGLIAFYLRRNDRSMVTALESNG